jgi:hypothetical protein
LPVAVDHGIDQLARQFDDFHFLFVHDWPEDWSEDSPEDKPEDKPEEPG